MLATAVILAGLASTVAAERGLRPVQVFEPGIDGIGTQNRDLVHDSRRVLYVGNQSGVLEFDGEWWRLITLPNNSAVRSLAADDRGRAAAGGYDEIGVLEPESSGRLAYRSLVGLLAEEEGGLRVSDTRTLATGEVDCHMVNDRLLLTAEDGVFEVGPTGDELQAMPDLDAIVEGDYRFLVRSQKPGRPPSSTAEFSFTVEPPWYRNGNDAAGRAHRWR